MFMHILPVDTKRNLWGAIESVDISALKDFVLCWLENLYINLLTKDAKEKDSHQLVCYAQLRKTFKTEENG